jgi:hypothetical protein
MFGRRRSELAKDALLGSTPFANGTPAEHPKKETGAYRGCRVSTRSSWFAADPRIQ